MSTTPKYVELLVVGTIRVSNDVLHSVGPKVRGGSMVFY